ncbi:hypothetical protein [Magnetospirillum sulfuroxidans]|uniref:Uncharacterized protein n=1 Tax=Magnetospirillum sulfuroxidans TaxID=611300 RepID=A0ABS5IDA4_9PROT|nr:hypothetical protein [Magnetospirillum sulfuroxidans]MBR9972400.1 hypothetical protein [Magnetospirillum sulfuroxidans]
MSRNPTKSRPGLAPPPTAFAPATGTAQRKATAAPTKPGAIPAPPTAFGPKPASSVQRAKAGASSFAPPPTAFGPPSAAMQRLAAPAAPRFVPPPIASAARPGAGVVQPLLQITDAGKFFDNEAQAIDYLTQRYRQILQGKGSMRALTPDENGRIKFLAAAAKDPRMVYPIASLQQAMGYIEAATSFPSIAYDRYPDRTPERVNDDATDWGFTYFTQDTVPTRYDIPQSPQHYSLFDDQQVRQYQQLHLEQEMSEVQYGIDIWKQDYATKSHLGLNHYAYNLRIDYRLSELEAFTDLSGEISYAQSSTNPPSNKKESTGSTFYTSTGFIPSQAKKGRKIDVRTNMKTKIQDLYDNYRTGSFAETYMFNQARPPNYFVNAEAKSIGTRYFHSEVQAASDMNGARKVARDAVDQVVAEAQKFIGSKTAMFSLVVTAVTIVGFSDSRTVCGNCCKIALADLAKTLETEVNTYLATQKTVAGNLKVRRSRFFSVSSHVGALMDITGSTVGAVVNTGTPSLSHHCVHEYKP